MDIMRPDSPALGRNRDRDQQQHQQHQQHLDSPLIPDFKEVRSRSATVSQISSSTAAGALGGLVHGGGGILGIAGHQRDQLQPPLAHPREQHHNLSQPRQHLFEREREVYQNRRNPQHRHSRSVSSSLPSSLRKNGSHKRPGRKASFATNPVMERVRQAELESEIDEQDHKEMVHHYRADALSVVSTSVVSSSMDYTLSSGNSGFRYAATPSAPSVSTFTPPMRTLRSAGSSASVTPGRGCWSVTDMFSSLRRGVRHLFRGCPISISIRIRHKERPGEEKPVFEQTLRIKNNRFGNPVYEVTRDEFHGGEQVVPVANLKAIFPHNKYLAKALTEWNRHFQNPPPHWLINFVPKAYLRRGYFLAEEVCEYFLEHPDGVRYRIEYEPIGHEWCLVGTIIPRPKKIRRERHPSRNWERREDP